MVARSGIWWLKEQKGISERCVSEVKRSSKKPPNSQ